MPSGLDSFLTWAVPLGIVIWGIYLIRSPLASLFLWLRGMFGAGVSKVKEADIPQPFSRDGNIIYR